MAPWRTSAAAPRPCWRRVKRCSSKRPRAAGSGRMSLHSRRDGGIARAPWRRRQARRRLAGNWRRWPISIGATRFDDRALGCLAGHRVLDERAGCGTGRCGRGFGAGRVGLIAIRPLCAGEQPLNHCLICRDIIAPISARMWSSSRSTFDSVSLLVSQRSCIDLLSVTNLLASVPAIEPSARVYSRRPGDCLCPRRLLVPWPKPR